MKKNCYNEIVGLHRFFQDWFNGHLVMNENTFERFSNVLEAEFELITPSGQRHTKKEILKLVWDSHSSRSNSDNPMNIWIENFRFRRISDSIFLVTYEEWQKIENNDQGRLSTALFKKSENKFNGIDWIHVHETFV